MSKNYEDTVADAILEVLRTSGIDVPEDQRLRDQIGAAAIRAVAEWNLAYAARARH